MKTNADLLLLAEQYLSDVEQRIKCILMEDDMGIREMNSDEIDHWIATKNKIVEVIDKAKKVG